MKEGYKNKENDTIINLNKGHDYLKNAVEKILLAALGVVTPIYAQAEEKMKGDYTINYRVIMSAAITLTVLTIFIIPKIVKKIQDRKDFKELDKKEK